MLLKVICLALGLIIFMIVNVILGRRKALSEGTFDKQKFKQGIYKGGIIFICLALVYFAGWLNKDIIAVTIDGNQVNMMQAVYLLILASYTYYATNIVQKFSKVLKSDKSGEPPDIIKTVDPNAFAELIETKIK